MSGSVVDVLSATAKIRRGKERKERKKERKKIETTAAKYNGLPITMGGRNKRIRNAGNTSNGRVNKF